MKEKQKTKICKHLFNAAGIQYDNPSQSTTCGSVGTQRFIVLFCMKCGLVQKNYF